MIFDYGKVKIKASGIETGIFSAGLLGSAYGVWHGNWKVAAAGALVAGAVAFRCYEKSQEVREPELMNAYFKTGGTASAASASGGFFSGPSMGNKSVLAGLMGIY